MHDDTFYVGHCGCNEPIHYRLSGYDVLVESFVMDEIEMRGSLVTINVVDEGTKRLLTTTRVPRHYIACHGPTKGSEWPALAEKYGWPA